MLRIVSTSAFLSVALVWVLIGFVTVSGAVWMLGRWWVLSFSGIFGMVMGFMFLFLAMARSVSVIVWAFGRALAAAAASAWSFMFGHY
jgi:hypothetical protein